MRYRVVIRDKKTKEIVGEGGTVPEHRLDMRVMTVLSRIDTANYYVDEIEVTQ